MLSSENATDFAIEGDGFFAVRGQDGEVYYTRNGNFTWSETADGRTILADAEGNPVLDTQGNEIALPTDVSSESMQFSEDGSIGYEDVSTGNVVSLNQSFAIYQFNNPAGLEKLSGSRLAATSASGNPMLESANPTLKSSKVHQFYLEGSNVQVADEMVNMIIAQRAYELNSKAITTSDSMLDTANNLKR
jgi:flagellar basal-body rod protein FlgG